MNRMILLLCLSSLFASCAVQQSNSTSRPITHEAWTALLATHVSESGEVDYRGFVADSLQLNAYLSSLSLHHPNKKNWSSNERKAFWINAYNAYTVKLIVENYPVVSIKDLGGSIYKVNTPWDIRFIEIEGLDYDLNNIEHDILRKEWNDARIHFAVNCASISCPPLLNEAFEASTLDAQLNHVTAGFINSKTANEITEMRAELSRIFKWFSGDFAKDKGSVIEFINTFSDVKLSEDADFTYKEYNWSLNGH
ncbi:MAG: DUF547 domain-containing protein [Flavobacteriales bacterium]